MKNIFIVVISLLFTNFIFCQELKLKNCDTSPEIIPFIEKGGKMGYCNKKGSVLVKPKFDYAGTFSFNFDLYISNNAKEFSTKEYATVQIEGKKYRIDKNGYIVLDFEDVDLNISECCAPVIRENTIIRNEVNNKSTYSVVNSSGIIMVPEGYDFIDYIYYIEKNSDYFIVRKNKKYGVINKNNEILIPLEYSSLHNMNSSVKFEDGIVFIGIKKNKQTVVDLCNNIYTIK